MLRKEIIRKEIYHSGKTKYDDRFGYEIPIMAERYYMVLTDLKDLILELDFEGAISTTEILKAIGYGPEELNELT